MLCALIMAGGKGTRFWPLSTEKKPKQFLNLVGNLTMLQMTVKRIEPIIDKNNIFICTNKEYVELVKEQLPYLPERNIIVEPEGRNTAPCIALSSMIIKKYYKEANMIVLPSDHLIVNEDIFRDLILKCNEVLNRCKRKIITYGITPNRPETGYGYIKSLTNEKVSNQIELKVDKFVEKPNKDLAKKYLDDGCYLWNSGIFMWNISNIIEKIKIYLPDTYEALKEIEQAKNEHIQSIINKKYHFTDKISIDYGILEKDDDIYVVPSSIGWDDIGSWEAIERYVPRDSSGNIHRGKISTMNATNNLIIATNQTIVVDGLSDIYVVENDGKVIIGRKSKVSGIKEFKEVI